MSNRIVINDERVPRFVAQQTGASDFTAFASIGIEDSEGHIIAGVVYDQYNKANVCMHVAAIAPGWLTRKFLWMVFDYPFNQLGVQRVTGLVPSTNVCALRFDTHLGFKQETKLIGAYPGGDLLVLRMFRHECRWLKQEVNHG